MQLQRTINVETQDCLVTGRKKLQDAPAQLYLMPLELM